MTYSRSGDTFDAFNASNVIVRRANGPEWLRILPLGASIVRGLGSDPKDGFRKPLRDHLRSLGYKVNMVGSQRNDYDNPAGFMRDGDHEGHEGAIIDQVYDNVDLSIDRRPNVVLVNAGTNDCVQNVDISTAHERLGRVVDKVFDKSQRATILLSTLLLNRGDAAVNARVQTVNENIRRLVADRRQRGQRIVLAEMNDGQFITAGDLSDDIHPNNYGYRKMAAVWNAAISRASNEGMLQSPEDTGISDDALEENSCKKVPGDGKGPVQVQKGSGDQDGAYNHRSTSMGSIFDINAQFEDSVYNGIFFAQLVNVLGNPDRAGALDDLVYWSYSDFELDGRTHVKIYPNLGGGKFGDGVTIDIDVQKPAICVPGSVHFGDVNNDGFDDIICIDRNADMYVSLHRGVNNGVPSFAWQGLYYAAPAGYERQHVRFGDIDGDGRLDYCLTHERDGDVHCWRNGGQGDKADYWQDYGVVFKSIGMGDIRGTRLVDLNGDFRSDWVWVGDEGETTIFTNSRGIDAGAAPYWIKATATHAGMHTAGARDRIKFGRIYGGNQVAYGGNRRDYIYVVSVDQGKQIYRHELRVWRNDGEGGTKLRADGNRYCDMTGDGRDDYIWMRSTGEMTMYRNIGDPPNWGQDGIIFNVNRDRKSVHLADWTGDGKCDILAVEKTTGRVEMWENTYGGSGSVTFRYRGWLDGALTCTEGWGVGVFDLGLRFADITGNGRADYLCMNPKGHTTGFLNNWPNGVENVGQIKFGVEKDRANHRWADVNGDGRADFLWVDKFDGSTEVWFNNGPVPEGDRPANSGSKFKWAPQGKLYNGISRGANQYYPDIDGNGKADIYNVNPVVNTADVWYNRCNEGGSGGGDDVSSDPDLPPYNDNAADTNAGYALSILSQKERLQTPVRDNLDYHYLPSSGKGVDVYIIDSGVNTNDKPGLKGRVSNEYSCVDGDFTDTRNHGTRVASLVASTMYGSAKGMPNILSYKIDNTNNQPDPACALEAFRRTTLKIRAQRELPGYKGSVVNFSGNIRASDELETSIINMINAGAILVTTAGNDNTDAKNVYPCNYNNPDQDVHLICVGAIDNSYGRWEDTANYGSGFGKQVHIWAPGKDVDVWNNNGLAGKATGTSYAAPLVAGIVATYVGWEGTAVTPERAKSLLLTNAETGQLSRLGPGSQNFLANNGYQKAGSNDRKPYIDAPEYA